MSMLGMVAQACRCAGTVGASGSERPTMAEVFLMVVVVMSRLRGEGLRCGAGAQRGVCGGIIGDAKAMWRAARECASETSTGNPMRRVAASRCKRVVVCVFRPAAISRDAGKARRHVDGTKKKRRRFWIGRLIRCPLPSLGERGKRPARRRAGARRELRGALGRHGEHLDGG